MEIQWPLAIFTLLAGGAGWLLVWSCVNQLRGTVTDDKLFSRELIVIAILATISIVAYTGIQNRAKTSSGQQLAAQIAKKFEALNAIKGQYNGSAAGVSGANINSMAK